MIKEIKEFLFNILLLTIGAILAAFAIELFLVNNNIIDGGVLGVSIILHQIFIDKLHLNWNLGFFVFFLNLPFIILALKKFGLRFVFSTFYSVTVLSIALMLWTPYPPLTKDLLLVSVFGGIVLGLGVGIVLRNTGSMDGTEILSILLAKKTGFSVGEIIMFFNVFIFAVAGFVFGKENAMYSVLTYFIAYRVIDIVQEGLNESKSVIIVSEKSEEIGQKIMKTMDTSITYLNAIGGYSGDEKKVIFFITSRLEIAKLKKIIKTIDPRAFVAIEDVHEVDGTRIKRK